MTEPLRRDEVIELLNRLGGDQDADVLEAAREVSARITAADMTWENLLVPDETDDETDDEPDDEPDEPDEIDDDPDDSEPDDDTDDDETLDPEDETTQSAGDTAAKHADSLALIDELLAKTGISTDLREELEGYKTDIAEGAFEARDRRYIRAIHKRLSKRR